MRILFLDAYFEPEQIAFTHLENDLIEGLLDAGHKIEVVCPTPTRGVSMDVVQKYKKKKSETLYNGRVHITRFSAPQEGKNPVIRALRYLWCNIWTWQIGKKMNGIDVVFSNSTPPTQGWIAGKVAKKLKVPFVYSLQDIFPDSLVNAGMVKKNGLIWMFGRQIEDKTYSYASKIITISNEFKENLLHKGVQERKITVIPNWIDTEEVYPVSRLDNKIIKKYNLNPLKFYVCYSGNIGHSQNLELLVDVAKQIQIENTEIEFAVIGEGAAKEMLVEMVKENRLSNFHVFPFQPYEDIAHVFSLGDVGLIISKPGIGASSVPSKTWSIMAARRPVLASFDADSALAQVIQEVGCGKIIEAGDKDGLVNAIKYFFEERNNLEICARSGYDFVSNNISKNKCVRDSVEIIKREIKKDT